MTGLTEHRTLRFHLSAGRNPSRTFDSPNLRIAVPTLLVHTMLGGRARPRTEDDGVSPQRLVVAIDIGTTCCAVSFADLDGCDPPEITSLSQYVAVLLTS